MRLVLRHGDLRLTFYMFHLQQYGGMRPPPNGNMGPGGPTMPGGPMSMPGGRPWGQPGTPGMSYSSASPGSHYGGPPVSGAGPPGPGTPIMPSPQGN